MGQLSIAPFALFRYSPPLCYTFTNCLPLGETVLSIALSIIPYILGILAIVALISFITAYRHSRKAPYFRLRKDASRQAGRWLLTFLFSVAGIVGAIFSKQYIPPADITTVFAPLLTPAATATTLPTLAPPTAMVEAVQTDLPPTITPTELPTPTSPATPTSPVTTIESAVTPPASAMMEITAVSSGISPSLTPINPDSAFPAGTPRIYFWVQFSSMANGISWSRVLLRDGTVIRSESEAWDRGEEGLAYYWFDAQGGWPAGNYEIQFYMGDQLVDSREFTVVN